MVALTSKLLKISTIPNYYAGKSVFITGGTGFVGKVLIEKLLYSCPDIDKVYTLIREKKGLSTFERAQQFHNNPLFNRLKNKRPKDLEKIVAIPGDIINPGLGLSGENENMLLDKVSVIIHGAATLKFNENLPVAWQMNVEGTREVLALSRKMKRLEVFVHISTAYTNTDREVVEEILYPPPADINEVYQYVKEGVTEEQTKKILDGRPNTYVFTKALAEHLVAENQAFVPTVIVRPSIVAAIKDAPIRGWVASWNGATALCMFTSNGMNRVIYGCRSNTIDLIPVDYVANFIITAGARSSNELQVYNCCSSACNPVTYGKLADSFIKNTIEQKSHNGFLPGWYTFTRHKWMVTLVTTLFQLIPAWLADFYRRLTGKNPRYLKLHYLAKETREVLDFFTSHSWVMKSDKVRELFASLSPADRHTFPCDPTSINWTEYLQNYYWGVQNLLKRTIRK